MGRAGMRKRAPFRPNQARQKMWDNMRHLRRFTSADIEAVAETGHSNTTKYIRFLRDGGYLREIQAKQEGIPLGHAVYQLVRDTGPYAPRIGNNELRDPNTQPQVLTPEERPVTIQAIEYQRMLRCTRACAGMDDPETEIALLRERAGA